jgi:hypothetical protein
MLLPAVTVKLVVDILPVINTVGKVLDSVSGLCVPDTLDRRVINDVGKPKILSPLFSTHASASCIVLPAVANLNHTPKACPLVVSVPVFIVILPLKGVMDVIPDDNVTSPATIRFIELLIVIVLVYPVKFKDNKALVFAATVHGPEDELNITSSPAAGTPEGLQLAAVAQVDDVVAIQVFVAIIL